jgi:hypothetical protein
VDEVEESVFLVGARGEGGWSEEQGMDLVVVGAGLPEGGCLSWWQTEISPVLRV